MSHATANAIATSATLTAPVQKMTRRFHSRIRMSSDYEFFIDSPAIRQKGSRRARLPGKAVCGPHD
jgi:hypothetical protein